MTAERYDVRLEWVDKIIQRLMLPFLLLLPLIQAINRLFQRMNESLEKEKRFTSDAAHELRTPLAVMPLR